ncbi:MAG: 4'-phosphopantetheinyl transferase superfamily protein [Proteobacteria bacterium]|nr:4'-phosphopantetheinyl transferase superfamily protein [Pseudomonadota bacterium]
MTIVSSHGLASHHVEWELSTLERDQLPRLVKGDVHLWAMKLEQPIEGKEVSNLDQQEAIYLPWLSSRESKKYTRLPANQKSHYLSGRIVLRKLLGAYLDKSPQDVGLAFGAYGKPTLLDSDGGPWFNYSDTQGMVIYAFGRSGELGIDIEHLSRATDYRRILKRKFSLAEAEEVAGTTERFSREIISQRFLAAWTRKESYGKAIGFGVNYKMNEIEVAKDLGLANISFSADGISWCLTQLLFTEYVVSLTTSNFENLRCFRLGNQIQSVTATEAQ